MTAVTSPLIERDLDSAIAYIVNPLPCFDSAVGTVSVSRFLGHVQSLAEQLPEADHLVNLCDNRYLFTVSYCAAILRNQVNLLPPNNKPGTQLALCERHPRSYVLHDGIAVAGGLQQLNLATLSMGDYREPGSVPEIPRQRLAAIAFTSGSTGQSKPNLKPWHTMYAGAGINRRYMLPDCRSEQDAPVTSMLATVPGQHMWGLETSVMLALMTNLCVADRRPLYPADICRLLEQLPAPRVMVSTPVHLRAMVMSGVEFPRVERVLCATAPLESALARQVETCFDATLCEIYGCSEIGSMAWRRTANLDHWRLFDAINFDTAGETTTASAEHVPESAEIQDLIEMEADGRFKLLGRQGDLIDIAGKRGSLKELNEILVSMEGVEDGVVFLPHQDQTVPRLVALVVLKNGVSERDVADHFRQRLDSAFVPRRILAVEKLPRAESGKLPHSHVLEMYEELLAQGSH